MKRERFIPYRRSDIVAMCKKHAKFYKVDEQADKSPMTIAQMIFVM